jgi:aspartate/methionine/tyrosine aminotransferase
MTGRGDSIAPFYVMEVMKAAAQREAGGEDVMHMEVGEPSTGAPPQVIAAAQLALDGKIQLGYTDALGIPPLRARIAQHYRATYDLDIDVERIIVTTGSSAGFVLSFLAAFEDGAAIGSVEPGYPAYRNTASALGFTPVSIPSTAATRFQLTPALLDASPNLSGLVIASPGNPTGTMLDRPALQAVVDWSAAHHVRLISDEIYHGITFGDPAVTAAALTDDAIIINSFSKYFSMTGWRIGWMVVPTDLVSAVERLAQNLYISAPALSQYAALAAFDAKKVLDEKVAEYRRNRDMLLRELPKAGFDKIAPVDGAFYMFADVSGLTDNAQEFCQKMLAEAGVATTPGIDFDPVRGKQFLRFSIAGDFATMEEAARRLRIWHADRG